jgi:hypothetical protein
MDPLNTWIKGRTILVGDAAHPSESVSVIFAGTILNEYQCFLIKRQVHFRRLRMRKPYTSHYAMPIALRFMNPFSVHSAFVTNEHRRAKRRAVERALLLLPIRTQCEMSPRCGITLVQSAGRQKDPRCSKLVFINIFANI